LTQLPISVLTIVGGIILLRYFHQQRMAEINAARESEKSRAEEKKSDTDSLNNVIQLAASSFAAQNDVLRGIQSQMGVIANTQERTGSVQMELVQRTQNHGSLISEHETKAAGRHEAIDTKLQSFRGEQNAYLNVLDGKVNSIQKRIDEFPNLVQASTDALFDKLRPTLSALTDSLKALATADELQILTVKVTHFIEEQTQIQDLLKEINDGTDRPTNTGITPNDSAKPNPEAGDNVA